jgi:hypothetical protein
VASKATEGSGDVLFRVEAALRRSNICILGGGRRVGKTRVARELLENHAKDSVCVYVDANRISLTPENFSIEFIGSVLWASQGKSLEGIAPFSIEHLLKKEKELHQDAIEHINAVHNELQKIKPDQRLLLTNSFAFPDAIAKQHKKQMLIAIDNAEQLLELQNFDAVRDIAEFFKEGSAKHVLVTSSSPEMAAAFPQAEQVAVGLLGQKHAEDLLREEWPGVDKKIAGELYDLSKGHPLVLSVLAKKTGGKNASKVFYSELLKADGELHRHCAEAIEYALSRARGQTLPKVILKVVANEELRLSEIARKIYRSAPVTKSLLERLIAVGLLKKEGKVFLFSDALLGLWVKLVSRGFEFVEEPTEEQLEEVMRQA